MPSYSSCGTWTIFAVIPTMLSFRNILHQQNDTWMAPFEEDRLQLAQVNTESTLMAYITPSIFSLTFSQPAKIWPCPMLYFFMSSQSVRDKQPDTAVLTLWQNINMGLVIKGSVIKLWKQLESCIPPKIKAGLDVIKLSTEDLASLLLFSSFLALKARGGSQWKADCKIGNSTGWLHTEKGDWCSCIFPIRHQVDRTCKQKAPKLPHDHAVIPLFPLLD